MAKGIKDTHMIGATKAIIRKSKNRSRGAYEIEIRKGGAVAYEWARTMKAAYRQAKFWVAFSNRIEWAL